MKKYLLLFLILIIPIQTFAVWYNPFTWFSNTNYGVNITVPQATQWGDVLRGNSNGTWSPVATSTLGISGSGSGGFDFPSNQTWGNATSTTLGFLNGFLSTASSTIIGNATTTGSMGAGAIYVNGDYITDFTGSNLSVTNGVLNASGSGGSGNVSTSTNETSGRLAYWTSTNGTPALLADVATTTLTASAPLSLSQPVVKVGGSNSVLTIDTSGTWSGNAGTATALATNGSNCSSGNAPLGVDASGAVESCFDVWTESENTSAGYINLSNLSATWPIVYNNGTGAFTFTGLSTTTNSGLSQGFMYIGSGGLIQTAPTSTALSSKQDVLVSGTNIKTINGSSILGSGDLTVTGSGSGLASSSPWTFGSLVVAKDNGSVTTISTSTISLSQFTNDLSYENPLTFNFPLTRSANTISNAFSTTSNSGMSQGNLYVGSGGIFQTAASSSIFGYTPLNPTRQLTIAGTANQITSSAGAQDLTADRTWILSIPSQFNIQQASTTVLSALWGKIGATASTTLFSDGSLTSEGRVTFPYSSSTIYSSFVTASTTNLIINGESFNDLTGTGLAISGNALVTSNIPNASLANSTISGISLGANLANLTATDSTLTFSGAYNGGIARTVGLNLANANTWTAKQDFFGSASSTLLSAHFAEFGATATTTFTGGGLVGVGTTSPSARLAINSVAGDTFSLWVGSTSAPWLRVSNTGFGTTTLSGLNIAGSATTTSNVGINLSAGCYAINGTCIGGGTGSGYATVQDEGSGLTQRTTINFTGSGVSCADNAGSSRTDCTINAGAASAGGSDTQIQFNDSSALGGAVGFVWNKTKEILGIGTTTPWTNHKVSIATSTGQNLVLLTGGNDPGIGFRNITGNLFVGTTSPTTGATSTSAAALIVDYTSATGKVGIGSTSPFALLSVDSPAGIIPFAIGSSTKTLFQVTPTKTQYDTAIVVGVGGKCSANITSDLPTSLSTIGCNTFSFTSDNTTSTNRTFCLQAGEEGQILYLFADVSGTNEIELADGAGGCAGSPATTFLNGVWPAATNQNNDAATLMYRTTASGAAADGWYELSRQAN